MTEFRLPTIDELRSLLNTPSAPKRGWYWSSSPDASNANVAWCVHFYYGNDYGILKDNASGVRLVRAGQNGSLLWKDEDEPGLYTWREAMEKFGGLSKVERRTT